MSQTRNMMIVATTNLLDFQFGSIYRVWCQKIQKTLVINLNKGDEDSEIPVDQLICCLLEQMLQGALVDSRITFCALYEGNGIYLSIPYLELDFTIYKIN